MIKDKMKLLPVNVGWRLGAYGIGFEAAESDVLTVKSIATFQPRERQQVAISFPSIAECRFYNFNFGEHHYNEFLIRAPSGEFVTDTYDWKEHDLFWKEKGVCPNPYFYEVENTGWFDEREIYGDLRKQGFRHFLLVGYDSYLEVLAKGDFTWKVNDNNE